MDKKYFIAAASGLLLLSGCASFKLGNDFDLTHFAANVEHGATTKSDIQQWLGAPQSTGMVVNREGEKLQRWLYYYSQGKLSSMQNTRMKTLEIQFDQQGIVQAYDWIGE